MVTNYMKCSGYMEYDPGDIKSLDWCRWRDVKCTIPYKIPCPVLELTERQHKDSLTIVEMLKDLYVITKKVEKLESKLGGLLE